MRRIRIRPLFLAAALGALALVPLASTGVGAKAGRTHEVVVDRPVLNNVRVLPALLPNSRENTSAIAQNNGTAPATIAMDIYTPAGVLIPSASKAFTNVPVGGTRTFAQASNDGLAANFRGVGVLSSDQPINALLVRDIESNTGIKSYSIHNAYPTGGNVVTLPYIANGAAGLYNTRFAIANTGTAVACVSVTYAFQGGSQSPYTDSGSGGSGCASGYPVPVGGQISFAPNTVDGAIAMPTQTAGAVLAATVNATGSTVTVGVDAYVTGLRKLASYDGFIVNAAAPTTDDIGTAIAIPLAIKLGGYYSQILLSNPNATAATATITYKDGTSGTTYPVTVTVPANGTANHSVYSDNVVPENFVGSATVASTQPVAAVLFRAKMTGPGTYIDEDLYTAVNGVPTDRATMTAKFPLIFRRIGLGGGLDGYNTWVSVATADGLAANLTINTVTDTASTPGSCGAAATYTTTKTITGSFVFYQNLDSDNGLGANPTCLWGGMTITSDKPIIAIADATNDIFPGDNDGLYNAFGN